MRGPARPSPVWPDAFLLCLLYLASRLPFLHTQGFPDGDASQIALGIADAVRSGTGFQGARLYGTAFMTGYYQLFFALGPWHHGDPQRLIPLMNGLGLVAGLVAQLSFWSLLRSLGGRSAAIAGSLLLLFTSAWWELNTFGHPTPLALALLLTSLVAWNGWLSARRPLPLALSVVLFLAAALVRGDVLLAGLAYPVLAWIRTRRRGPAAMGVAVVVAAAVAVQLTVRIALASAPVAPSAGHLWQAISSIFDFGARTLIKKFAVAVVGAGPAIFFALVAGGVVCAIRRRFDPLLLAAAVVLPEAAWWLPVEGPFRHWLVAYVFAIVPFAIWIGEESPRRALALVLPLVIVNQLFSAALYAPLAREYPFTYREVPGERRWSTRAPLGDWFSHHATAARAVREEAQAARWLAELDRPAVLVVALSPYRMEWEVLARHTPTRYEQEARSGVIWVTLETDGRKILFVEGDPERTHPVLDKAFAAGELSEYAVYIPRWAEPITPYAIPAGTERIGPPASDDSRQRTAP